MSILILLALVLAYLGIGIYVAKTKAPAFTWNMVLEWPVYLLRKQ